MLHLLLNPDARARLRRACGVSLSAAAVETGKLPAGINYDALRGHEMFANALSILTPPAVTVTTISTTNAAVSSTVTAAEDGVSSQTQALVLQVLTATDELSTVEGVRSVYERPAVRVPTLREICLRATGRAALLLAAATAENGGVRPKTPQWMQVRVNSRCMFCLTIIFSVCLFVLTEL